MIPAAVMPRYGALPAGRCCKKQHGADRTTFIGTAPSMSYVDSQLLPDETVRYRARLHRGIFTAASVFGVLTLAARERADQPQVIGGGWPSPSRDHRRVHLQSGLGDVQDLRVRGHRQASGDQGRLDSAANSGDDALQGGRDRCGPSLTGRALGYGTIEVTGTSGTKRNSCASPIRSSFAAR